MGNGDTRLENRGVLTDIEINAIRAFIKENYLDMYKKKWPSKSDKGVYGE